MCTNVALWSSPWPACGRGLMLDRDGARTVYRTGDGDHELVVQLEGRRCLDTMADDEYETTVTVTLDGRGLRGCGRPLH